MCADYSTTLPRGRQNELCDTAASFGGKNHSNKPAAFLAKHDIGGSDAEKSVKAELRQQFRSVYIVFPYFGKATMRGEELS